MSSVLIQGGAFGRPDGVQARRGRGIAFRDRACGRPGVKEAMPYGQRMVNPEVQVRLGEQLR